MNKLYYLGTAKTSPEEQMLLEPSPLRNADEWSGYEAESELEAAVNVSLLLGQPLLLTGEPGTGKTQLAFHLSHQFGWGEPFVFEAKSTSSYRDLFYTYDAVGRFHASASGGSNEAVNYIEYAALGRAILRTQAIARVSRYLRRGSDHDGPKPSVVLIDEIDKASRDFPNDILREIENLYFKVPEVDLEEIRADKKYRPVVIITSNSEKNLPPAFLRRCTFFHIPPPSDAKLARILENRTGPLPVTDSFFNDAIAFYKALRDVGLDKNPGIAELIAFVAYLRARGVSGFKDLSNRDTLSGALSVLAKSEQDMRKAADSLRLFLEPSRTEVPRA